MRSGLWEVVYEKWFMRNYELENPSLGTHLSLTLYIYMILRKWCWESILPCMAYEINPPKMDVQMIVKSPHILEKYTMIYGIWENYYSIVE